VSPLIMHLRITIVSHVTLESHNEIKVD
jgi:hypothetical protein